MILPYFCTPFEKRTGELIAQLVEHPDFIGKALGLSL
jgi:hypothetical protein